MSKLCSTLTEMIRNGIDVRLEVAGQDCTELILAEAYIQESEEKK